MPRSEEQYEQIREERKVQIMNVALELIAEEGFNKVSISKIAKKAEISKGLMYNYFKSKEELILLVMLDGFDQLISAFDANKDGTLTSDEMHFFIDKTFETLETNITFWRMYFMVMLQPDVFKLIQPYMHQMLSPFMETSVNYFIEKGYEDPEAETQFFAAMLDGVGLRFVMDPENFPLEGIKKKLHNMYK